MIFDFNDMNHERPLLPTKEYQSPNVQDLASEIAEEVSLVLTSERIPEKSTDFEPFVQKEGSIPPTRQRFICKYGGPYSTQMELNRTVVERFIQLSRLGGVITLSSLPYSRTRGHIEVNPDFSVTGKKKLTWGERKIDEEENPDYKVTVTGDGWVVQINGQGILEKINEKKDGKLSKEKRFTQLFNKCLRQALSECLLREKLSSEKDALYPNKLFSTLFQPALNALWSITFHHHSLQEFIYDLTLGMFIHVPMAYGLVNFLKIKSGYPDPNLRTGPEIFLPPLRIEDVILGKTYLEFQGRTLVRLQNPSLNQASQP